MLFNGEGVAKRLSYQQAKEMVELSKSIATKIKDKQGDITEDEVRTEPRGVIIYESLQSVHIWCFFWELFTL